MARSVLIVEDDREIRDLLVHYLRKEGYEPSVAADGESGLAQARRQRPALILLDILLPGMDGLELLRAIRGDREIGATPVVMLTAKGDETDRVVGLELGADDYIPKPFSPREVVARIRAVARRCAAPLPGPPEDVHVRGELRLDAARREVTWAGTPVALTAKEFGILEALMASRGRVLSRDAILARVWGGDTYVTDRTVDVHIARIRRKIPALAAAIRAVKDAGYKLGET